MSSITYSYNLTATRQSIKLFLHYHIRNFKDINNVSHKRCMFMIHLHIKLHITSFSDWTQILCGNHVVHLTSLNKFIQKDFNCFPELMIFVMLSFLCFCCQALMFTVAVSHNYGLYTSHQTPCQWCNYFHYENSATQPQPCHVGLTTLHIPMNESCVLALRTFIPGDAAW